MSREEAGEHRVRIRETETLCQELAAELRRKGVVLPSLRVDVLSYAGEDAWPLVELGRCNVATVRALLGALRGEER